MAYWGHITFQEAASFLEGCDSLQKGGADLRLDARPPLLYHLPLCLNQKADMMAGTAGPRMMAKRAGKMKNMIGINILMGAL